jgi:poly(hydroxyalkanoate) granule-associated protein
LPATGIASTTQKYFALLLWCESSRHSVKNPQHLKPLEGIIMAKLKKSARSKTTGGASQTVDLQAKAEQMSKSIVDSAQQIWMAGMGAFNRAQGEGSKLFEALVKEGMNIEQHTRKLAGGKVEAVRDAVENRVGVARERATDTWDRLEKVFEERVQRALNRLGVPSSEDLSDLTARVNSLTDLLRKQAGKAEAKPLVKAVKVAKPAAKKSVKAAKPAAKKAVKAVKAAKPAAKKAVKTAAKTSKKLVAKAKPAARKAALPNAVKPIAPSTEA